MVKTPFRFESSSKCIHVTQDGIVATYCTGESYTALLGSDTGILFGDPNLVLTGNYVRSAPYTMAEAEKDNLFDDSKGEGREEEAAKTRHP